MPTVALVGTLDTKGDEIGWIRELLTRYGCGTCVIDVGVLGRAVGTSDISPQDVAVAAGWSLEQLVRRDDRGFAMEVMAAGATSVVSEMYRRRRIHAILSVGGSGGSAVATAAMRALPIGFPKLMVSTIVSGDVRPYVGQSDITMMHSVLDIAGLNSVSREVFRNAAAAAAAMAKSYAEEPRWPNGRPGVAISMFGVTTAAVTAARELLESRGFEAFVFHANGAGGRAMETMIDDGRFVGVLDLTTTEIADELVGGALSAGPRRLEAAGRQKIPQVVSLGALDMVNFGPPDSVPQSFKGRVLYRHNANVTLMRTSAEECKKLGREIGRKLKKAAGPVTVFIPLRGVSAISQKHGVFYDPEADAALFDAVEEAADGKVPIVRVDTNINDVNFSRQMVDALESMIREGELDVKN